MNPTQFFKCLADDTRLKTILLIESEVEMCVCELMTALDDSQPKISRHLAQLKKSGVLVDRKQRQWVFYKINPELATWAKDVIALAKQQNTEFLQPHLRKLSAMGDRPERMNSCCN